MQRSRGRLDSRWKLLLLLLIPTLLFSFVVIRYAVGQVVDYLRQDQQETIEGMTQQVVFLMKKDTEQIVDILLELEHAILQQEQGNKRWDELMRTVSTVRSDFVRGIVYRDQDDVMYGYPDNFWGYFSEQEVRRLDARPMGGKPAIVWSEQFRSHLGKMGTFSPVSMASKIVLDEEGERLGLLSIVVDLTAFLERTSAFSAGYDTQTLLYDQDGILIDYLSNFRGVPMRGSAEELQTLEEALRYFEERQFYLASSQIYNPAWTVLVVGNVDIMDLKLHAVTRQVLSFLIVGILGFMLIYILVSLYFTRPIAILIRGIRRVAQGDFDHQVHLDRQDEFGEMAKQFNDMTLRIKALIGDLKESEERKRSSDFQALLSQINPHFLYNTLNSLDMMVDIGSKEELHQMIAALGRMLRYALNQSGEQGVLSEEWRHIEDYLFIQSIRYDRRFDYHLVLPADYRNMIVLKLIIQPIVENAVFHGLHALRGRRGMLEVGVGVQDNKLCILVTDNGVGMDEQILRQIQEMLEADTPPEGQSGIGLRNVHQRIRMYAGECYGLDISSTKGIGTCVTIWVPLQRDQGGCIDETEDDLVDRG